MSIANLNYYYYIDYFNFPKIDFQNPNSADCEKQLREQNSELANYNASSNQFMQQLDVAIAPQSLTFQTVYPGLLIGTGISHAFGGKGEAALGLCLDYVTGLPYIPGSSVKGILRSAFCHKEYIKSLLTGAGVVNSENIRIDELEARIFGNSIDKKKAQYDVPAKEQDIFYDAIVISPGKILATDAITPHRQNTELLELANPNPITMIRIRPDVKFKFQFNLKKETLGVTDEQKLVIFREILQDLGIGAKTNVGYGSLTESNTKTVPNHSAQATKIGVCQRCGKPTGINTKTGKPYLICGTCNYERRR